MRGFQRRWETRGECFALAGMKGEKLITELGAGEETRRVKK